MEINALRFVRAGAAASGGVKSFDFNLTLVGRRRGPVTGVALALGRHAAASDSALNSRDF